MAEGTARATGLFGRQLGAARTHVYAGFTYLRLKTEANVDDSGFFDGAEDSFSALLDIELAATPFEYRAGVIEALTGLRAHARVLRAALHAPEATPRHVIIP